MIRKTFLSPSFLFLMVHSVLLDRIAIAYVVPVSTPTIRPFPAGKTTMSVSGQRFRRSSTFGFKSTPDSGMTNFPISTQTSTTLQALSLHSISGSIVAKAASSILPACLGLWKIGYGISYAYGGTMLLSAMLSFLHITSASPATLSSPALKLALFHAITLFFYGARLIIFLLKREITLPVEIHQMKRKDASFKERLKRLPVIFGCATLYYLLSSPLRITTSLALGGFESTIHATKDSSVLLILSLLGFVFAAWGDSYKSNMKAKAANLGITGDCLITTGPYLYFRHPNYTGEMFGWTFGLIAMLRLVRPSAGLPMSIITWLAASVLGWIGIMYVLAVEATAGLERKQKKKYGGTEKYDLWMKNSWSGPMLPIK